MQTNSPLPQAPPLRVMGLHSLRKSGCLKKSGLERRACLECFVTDEDRVLYVGLCDGCVARIEAKNKPGQWEMVDETFKVI